MIAMCCNLTQQSRREAGQMAAATPTSTLQSSKAAVNLTIITLAIVSIGDAATGVLTHNPTAAAAITLIS
jgi:hypothetical protein